MGEKAEDIIDSFRLSGDSNRNSYAIFRGEFEVYFLKKRNALAKYCNFKDLHNELIRDILVASIREQRSSERLQMDGADLTLEKP